MMLLVDGRFVVILLFVVLCYFCGYVTVYAALKRSFR